jgi:hypothetical protein
LNCGTWVNTIHELLARGADAAEEHHPVLPKGRCVGNIQKSIMKLIGNRKKNFRIIICGHAGCKNQKPLTTPFSGLLLL